MDVELRSSYLDGGAHVWAGLRNDGKLNHRSGTKLPWGCLQKGTVKTASPAPKLLSSFRIAVHMYGRTDHTFRTLCFGMCTTYIVSVLEHVIRNILVYSLNTHFSSVAVY